MRTTNFPTVTAEDRCDTRGGGYLNGSNSHLQVTYKIPVERASEPQKTHPALSFRAYLNHQQRKDTPQ